jgi:hypothetical protein
MLPPVPVMTHTLPESLPDITRAPRPEIRDVDQLEFGVLALKRKVCAHVPTAEPTLLGLVLPMMMAILITRRHNATADPTVIR